MLNMRVRLSPNKGVPECSYPTFVSGQAETQMGGLLMSGSQDLLVYNNGLYSCTSAQISHEGV